VYEAWKAALTAARATPAAPVPLHIRNAPTGLMKELGYGEGYRYAHAVPEGYLPQEYLPDTLRDQQFYTPTAFGFEREVAKRLAWWSELRARMSPAEDADVGAHGTAEDAAADAHASPDRPELEARQVDPPLEPPGERNGA
jgi:putative ATPase